MKKLADLQKGKSADEQHKLAAAECALTQCAAGVPDNDPDKAALTTLQNEGQSYTDQQRQLKDAGAFDGYGWADTIVDLNDRDHLTTRAGGAVQGVGMASLAVLVAGGGCSTGVGCGLALTAAGTSLDYSLAGFKTAVSGDPMSTYGEQVLQGLGMSPTGAALTYGLINGGAAGGSTLANGIGKTNATSSAGPTAADDSVSNTRPAPNSLKNGGGSLDGAGNAARDQPYGGGASASPGANEAGNSGASAGVSGSRNSVGVRSFVAPNGVAVDLPPSGSMTNVDVRNWYLEQEAKIPDLIDPSASLEDRAQQAWSLRNAFRTAARDAMVDQQAAAQLNSQRPNMTWSQTVQKYSSQYSGDELWNQIIGASQRSNASVNQSLGVVPPGRKP